MEVLSPKLWVKLADIMKMKCREEEQMASDFPMMTACSLKLLLHEDRQAEQTHVGVVSAELPTKCRFSDCFNNVFRTVV